jgi:hypothetical protein
MCTELSLEVEKRAELILLYKRLTDTTDCELPLVLSLYFFTNNVRKVHEILEQSLGVKLTLSSERYQYFKNVIVELFPGETLFKRIYQFEISADPLSLELMITLTTELLKGGTIDLSHYNVAQAVVGIMSNASTETRNLVDLIDALCMASVNNRNIATIDNDYLSKVLKNEEMVTLESVLVSYYLLKLNKQSSSGDFLQNSRLLENIPIRAMMLHAFHMYPPLYPKLVSLMSYYSPAHFSRLNYLINLSLIERKWFRNLQAANSEKLDYTKEKSIVGWLELAQRTPVYDTSSEIFFLLKWISSNPHSIVTGEYFLSLWNRCYIENPQRTCRNSLLALQVDANTECIELWKNPQMLIKSCEVLLSYTDLVPILLRVHCIHLDCSV